MAKRLRSLSSRIFHTLAEFEEEAEQTTKSALIYTLDYFKDKFEDIIEADIYNNAYKATWYNRTNWMKDENALEVYIYKNIKNSIGGGVRFNKQTYEKYGNNRSLFQHGNPYKYLEMNSYLAIMNDSDKLHANPYNFPTHAEINRGHFYDEFLDLVDAKFDVKFSEFWHFASTGKRDLRGYGNNKRSVGATSSSTRQYASLHSSNIG